MLHIYENGYTEHAIPNDLLRRGCTSTKNKTKRYRGPNAFLRSPKTKILFYR